MNSRSRRFLTAVAALILLASMAVGQGLMEAAPRPDFVPGQLVIGYEGDAPTPDAAQAVQSLAASPVMGMPKIDAQVVQLPPGTDMLAAAREVAKQPGVRYAEPNYYRRALIADPNDPGYTTIDTLIAPWEEQSETYFQWPLHVVNAAQAWGVYPNTYYTQATKPANPTKIAVLDTGIDCGGPDGNPHLDFINAGGSSPDAALGGQIDMANGRNVITGAPDPANFVDDYGHGTAVSSVAAASANNGAMYGTGIAGMGYHAQILPVKVIDNIGYGTQVDMAAAIIWAVDHGALIINISAGEYTFAQMEQDACDYAWANGSLIIAAAGNDGAAGGGGNKPLYPACLDNVIAVGATTWEPLDYPATYSNTGYYLTLAAPAGDVSYVPLGFWLTWCAMPTDDVPLQAAGWEPGSYQYQYHAGTSLSCPLVAGLASLYAASRSITQSTPGGNLDIWKALCRGCDGGGFTPNWNPELGWGRVDAFQTLSGNDHRGATLGGMNGQVRYKSTVVKNADVKVYPEGSGTPLVTVSSKEAGIFSVENIAPGPYDVTASYFGEDQTIQHLVVESGYDLPGIRFNISGPPPSQAPVLAWAGAVGYETDGCDPDSGKHDARITWKVHYSDANGDAPTDGVKVRILRNTTEIDGSPFAMTSGVISDYVAGGVFTYSRKLPYGDYSCYFSASDGTDNATGAPTSELSGPVIITGPKLLKPRILPDTGDSTTRFRYRVNYATTDGKPATWVELQVYEYTDASGWQRHLWRLKDVADDSRAQWKLRIAKRYPNSTAFRYRFRVLKKVGTTRLYAETDWTDGPTITDGAAGGTVSALAATPTRAGGAEIVFSLSGPATATATVRNLAGRPVRVLPPTEGQAGMNTLLWDGRSSSGTQVPSGSYIVEVAASAPDGSQSRALTPLRMAR